MEMIHNSMAPQPFAAAQLPCIGEATLEELPRSVFCKGLSKGASERCVATMFQTFGNVVDCQVARHRSGRSAGFAIVSFATHEQARLALQAMDQSTFLGRKLGVRWYQPEKDAVQQAQQAHFFAAVGQQLQGLASVLTQPPVSLEQLLSLGGQQPAAAPAPPPQPPAPLQQVPLLFGQADATWAGAWAGAQAQANVAEPSLDNSTEGGRKWSALVGDWLADYLHQDPQVQLGSISEPGASPMAAARHSFDVGSADAAVPAAPTAVERRRSTRDSLSRCLDGLNLADCCESPSFLTKSRLATKWSTEFSGGGATSNGAPAAAPAARPSDEFNVIADIQLSPWRAKEPKLLSPRWAALPSCTAGPDPWAISKQVAQAPNLPSIARPAPQRTVTGSWGGSSQGDVPPRCPPMDPARRTNDMQMGARRQQAPMGMVPPQQFRQRSPQQQQQQMGMHPALEAQLQLQQWQAMHQAQEQYASAMQQLNSAQSQMMAAAAMLQGAGMMAAPQLPMPMATGRSFAPSNVGPVAANAFVMLRNPGARPMF